MNKLKVINDPVYGFVNIPYPIVYDVIAHPYFQRLRRIKQLGLTCLVYPGAEHTRFHHALGAMYLMQQAIQVLRFKGIKITDNEAEGVTLAILLHDIGHGPFSHALEHSIAGNIHHEELSRLIMQALNATFEGKLSLCIDIFEGNYHKKFLHQLVSSQLDMDRLDYLNRDSFFTGVSEGVVGWDRIIKMLNVANDELVVEEKGIYSIEKFLVARRLMYWQAYLHKTSVAAELMLMQILRRAKQVSKNKNAPPLFATPSLQYFLENDCVTADFLGDNSVALEHFNQLDDYDVLTSIKVWCNHSDKPLAFLCLRLMQRKLYKMHLQALPFAPEQIEKIVAQTTKKFGFDAATDAPHLVLCGTLTNSVYDPKANEAIKILLKTGVIADISDVSTMIDGNSQAVVKHYVCYPV